MSINGIEITDIRIYPLNEHPTGAKALVKIIINDILILQGIKILNGNKGIFLKFPTYFNQASISPITAELRNYISNQILSQYKLSKNKLNA